jgi:multidrug efflux pump subunit AcrB
MNNLAVYLLIPVMATLLVSAQAMWGLAIKQNNLISGGILQTLTNLLGSPKIWIGAMLYAGATLVYFLMLSKGKFFVIQISMAGVATILSTLLAAYLFGEHISLGKYNRHVFSYGRPIFRNAIEPQSFRLVFNI